jgi:hypothetical protein
MPLNNSFLCFHPSTDNKSDSTFLNILFDMTKLVPLNLALHLPLSLRKKIFCVISFACSLQKFLGLGITFSN